jgi:hypothetical protein
MGKLTAAYRKAIIRDVLQSVLDGQSSYYAFAADPSSPAFDQIPPIVNNDYSVNFLNDWQMIFGKRLQYNNFAPVIKRVLWTSGTTYTRYDNTVENFNELGGYYVYSQRVYQGKDFGGGYYVYKCIDNNYDPVTKKGTPSLVDPGTINDPTQKTTFETSDGYKWRYLTTVSNKNMFRFSTGDLALSNGLSPINPEQDVQTTAAKYCGVDVINILNGGTDYRTWNNGIIQSFTNSSVLEIGNDAFAEDQYYNNNAIYIYNSTSATSQLFRIANYYTQSKSRFIVLDGEANTDNIIPGSTKYTISPRVVIESDGIPPRAYSVINATSNAISKIIVLDSGSDISWANVKIYSNPSYGRGANLYAIVPPPGGHGSDPEAELNVLGFGISFQFANNESGSIPDDITYDKIGIVKNPYKLDQGDASKSIKYTSNTFNQLLVCNVNQTAITGQTVIGETSNSRGVVVLSNSSELSICGDQTFQNGENLLYANGVLISQIAVDKRGDIYTKELFPLYVQNINKVTRTGYQTEEFKLVIQL